MKLIKVDELEESKKKKKKKVNALGWFQTFTPDAGNVEYNNAFFNHVMGNTDSGEFADAVVSAESGGMGESLEKNKETENMENIDWDKVQWGVHQFSTASIIFRGTEEECQQYIDDRKELWDDAEVYFMTPDDPHYLKEETEEKKICSICGEEYEGWGNNAWPYNDGRCCDSCNYLFVLPERIKHIQKKKETPDVSEAFDELNKLDD